MYQIIYVRLTNTSTERREAREKSGKTNETEEWHGRSWMWIWVTV